jgi:hypothetical protein
MTIERRALRMGRPPRVSIVLVVRLRRAARRRVGRVVAANQPEAIRRGWNIVQSVFRHRG